MLDVEKERYQSGRMVRCGPVSRCRILQCSLALDPVVQSIPITFLCSRSPSNWLDAGPLPSTEGSHHHHSDTSRLGDTFCRIKPHPFSDSMESCGECVPSASLSVLPRQPHGYICR